MSEEAGAVVNTHVDVINELLRVDIIDAVNTGLGTGWDTQLVQILQKNDYGIMVPTPVPPILWIGTHTEALTEAHTVPPIRWIWQA